MFKNKVRIISLGLVHSENGYYLFDSIKDWHKGISFLRPIGGEIKFGETTAEALIREFAEETSIEVLDQKLLNVFENIFEYNRKKAHEIVFLYEASISKKWYKKDVIPIQEESENREARWFAYEKIKDSLIFPEEIKQFLKN